MGTASKISPDRILHYTNLAQANPHICKVLTPKLTKYIPHIPSIKQTAFLSLSDHLEIFYGGAASGGKSDALLMAALQYVDVPGYAALLLRRTFRELSLPGALMDRARVWLKDTDASWHPSKNMWSFPSGATLTFGYLQHEKDVYQYDSAEFQFIGFDELTQFTETQYRFLFGRIRKKVSLNVPLRMRAASNPGGVGHLWVKDRFIKHRKPGRLFIPAFKEDNEHVDQDSYDKSLAELDEVTRRQRAEGDWDAEFAGTMFKRHWFKMIDLAPIDANRCRAWDLAGTEGGGDYTVGTLLAIDDDGRIFVEDVIRDQWGPAHVEKVVKQSAEMDGYDVLVRLEQEPGSSGKSVSANFVRMLIGYDVKGVPASGHKTTRWKLLAAQAEVGNVYLVSAPWNSPWIDEMCGVPNTTHDDQADSVSLAFNTLAEIQREEYSVEFL